jgi:5-oxoprolinase (ATP-hydrolysing)
VFRTLVDDDIPLNAGCLKPLSDHPAGSMLNPNPPASVVAGNVETSSCITNALYAAPLGVMAASQCTMNNFTFVAMTNQYAETISGGSGAGGTLTAPAWCRPT